MQILTNLPAVAKNFRYDCKKCGCERYFRVLAHLDSLRAKIECEVCGAKRTFKLELAKSGGKVAKKKTSRKRSVGPTAEETWLKLKEEIGTENTQPYNMRASFKAMSVIDHPKFGLGFVTECSANAISVAFQEGSKSLVHNRP